MIRTTTLVLAALVPALASAQLGTARGAVKTADEASAGIQRQADALIIQEAIERHRQVFYALIIHAG